MYYIYIYIYIKLMWSRYRPSVAQRVGIGIALLFHDRGTRRGWVVTSTHRPHFTCRKDPVPILQEAGWAPGLVWTGGKSRPNRDSIPNRPAHSQSLYQLHYTHSTAQFLMWHTITFFITAIIYLLLQPTTPTGHVLWQFVQPQSSTKVCIHTSSPECKKNCMSWQALCLSWHFLFIRFSLIFPTLLVFH